MALYAFDGTWNTVKSEEDKTYENTNVVRFFRAYNKNRGDKDFYVEGVGTRFDLLGKLVGGFFGMGELTRINEAYDHLCEQWAKGDRDIDVVGFSRGAATTLDFCQRIKSDGIRQPNSNVVVEPDPHIRFVGVWDVVGRSAWPASASPISTSATTSRCRNRKSNTASTPWRSTSAGRPFSRRVSMARPRSGSGACTRTSAAGTRTSA